MLTLTILSLLLFPCASSVWRSGAPGRAAAGVAFGADRGLRGVLSSRRRAEGTREGRRPLQVRGGRPHQQPHCEDSR